MDQFEWDVRRARFNRRRHGIAFADTTAVFGDERALTLPDGISAVDEPRMLTLGRDALARIVVVAYTRRGERLRLLSARPATPAERRHYRRRDA